MSRTLAASGWVEPIENTNLSPADTRMPSSFTASNAASGIGMAILFASPGASYVLTNPNKLAFRASNGLSGRFTYSCVTSAAGILPTFFSVTNAV